MIWITGGRQDRHVSGLTCALFADQLDEEIIAGLAGRKYQQGFFRNGVRTSPLPPVIPAFSVG
jgi:hypothetical protein